MGTISKSKKLRKILLYALYDPHKGLFLHSFCMTPYWTMSPCPMVHDYDPPKTHLEMVNRTMTDASNLLVCMKGANAATDFVLRELEKVLITPLYGYFDEYGCLIDVRGTAKGKRLCRQFLKRRTANAKNQTTAS